MAVLKTIRDTFTNSLADVKVYQELFARSKATPPRQDAKIRVIGAGFSRTATLSMYTAMLDLGSRCYHGIELECTPGVSDKWIKVLEHDLKTGSTEGINWADVVQGFDAGFDVPFADYWLELSRAYPDAKIVYTHRSGKDWIKSYHTAILDPMQNNIWFRLAAFWFPNQRKIVRMMDLVLAKYERDLGGLHHTLIDKRLEAIKQEIPAERLLVFHPSEGWEPLCKFLALPVPDKPFPKINDGPSMAGVLNAIAIVGMGLWVVTIAIAIGAGMWLYAHLV